MSNQQWSKAEASIEGVALDLVAFTLALPTETTTNLADVAHSINTSDKKVQGAVVYNTTTDNPVYAAGAAAADIWVDGAGTTAHSPV